MAHSSTYHWWARRRSPSAAHAHWSLTMCMGKPLESGPSEMPRRKRDPGPVATHILVGGIAKPGRVERHRDDRHTATRYSMCRELAIGAVKAHATRERPRVKLPRLCAFWHPRNSSAYRRGRHRGLQSAHAHSHFPFIGRPLLAGRPTACRLLFLRSHMPHPAALAAAATPALAACRKRPMSGRPAARPVARSPSPPGGLQGKWAEEGRGRKFWSAPPAAPPRARRCRRRSRAHAHICTHMRNNGDR